MDDVFLTVHLILFEVGALVVVIYGIVYGFLKLKWSLDSNPDHNGVRDLRARRYRWDLKFLIKCLLVTFATLAVHIALRVWLKG